MPAGTPQSSRTRLLRQLGIDVFVSRPTAGSPDALDAAGAATSDAAPQEEQPPALADLRATDTSSAAAAALAEAAAGLAEKQGDRHASQPSPPVPSAQPAATESPGDNSANESERFSVICLAAENVLLLIEADAGTGVRRISTDLLAGWLRQWPPAHEPFEFQWPQGTLSGDAHSANRALSAFVDRRLESAAEDVVVIVCEGAAARLERLLEARAAAGASVIRVPRGAALLGNAEAKRALWATLQAGAG